MTIAEILDQIHRLPVDQQRVLTRKLLEEVGTTPQADTQFTQDEFDRMLMQDGLLVNWPVDDNDEEDFDPVEFVGQPISQTIIDERR